MADRDTHTLRAMLNRDTVLLRIDCPHAPTSRHRPCVMLAEECLDHRCDHIGPDEAGGPRTWCPPWIDGDIYCAAQHYLDEGGIEAVGWVGPDMVDLPVSVDVRWGAEYPILVHRPSPTTPPEDDR